MKGDDAADIHVRYPVAVCEQKQVVVNVLRDSVKAAARHTLQTSVRERNAETLLRVITVIPDLRLLPETNREIVIHCLVVQEVFLNCIPTVAEAQHEVAKTMPGVG